MSKVVKLVVIGAGSRGNTYSTFATNFPDRAQVVAVVDPDAEKRNRLADKCGVPAENRYNSWEEFVQLPKMADAVLICTQDAMHEGPAVACAKCGYDILLEKPMAPTEESCKRIVAAVKEAGVIFAVCHVLRYTKYTRMVKQLIESGRIGDIISIQHLEPLGYWHQAHSFVRGKWRNEAESSFMLLAKSCHDVDWLRGIMDRKCKKIQSFGSLRHFKASEKPAGAADRCVDCPAAIESRCPYSALKIYFRDRFDCGHKLWPVNVLTADVTEENLMEALKTGPYGRCVYACDNDVVDTQTVNMLFEDDTTVSMTMTAFDFHSARKSRIFGTRGQIETDSRIIKVREFANETEEVIDTETVNDGGILSGHGGGDFGLMEAFVKAVAEQNSKYILSGTDETLESHLMVFAAEKSRRNGTVETL